MNHLATTWTSRLRKSRPPGCHHVDHLRQVDQDQPPAVHEQVVRRQVAVRVAGPGPARERVDQLAPEVGQLGRARAQSGPAAARPCPSGVADELQHQLGAEQLHRVRHATAQSRSAGPARRTRQPPTARRSSAARTPVRLAIARFSRDSRTRRPSR